MKRSICLCIAAVMLLTLFASCGKKEESPDVTESAEKTNDVNLPDTPEGGDFNFPSEGVYIQYAVNSSTAGSISGVALQSVQGRETAEVTATPNLGYRFVRWSDGNENPVRKGDKADENRVITAIFDYDQLEMPIFSIVTETGEDVQSKTEYIGAKLTVLGTDKKYQLDQLEMQIRGRGNNTWSYEKKSYKMKLSEKQSLLGLGQGKAKKWVLLANHCDQSLLRNYVALHLAASMPSIAWSPDCTSVEVYLNGEYRGVYLLAEEIDVNKNKVAVSEEVTGKGADIGYLIEMTSNGKDITFDAGTKSYQIHNDLSDNSDEMQAQYDYIADYVQSCWDALTDGEEEAIDRLIDIDSLVDAYLMEEIVKNLDVGWDSFYLYKDAGGKLTFGPLWDFDLALGNADEGCEDFESLYAAYKTKMQSNPWFYTAMNQQWFRQRVVARWDEIAELRSGLSAMVTDNAQKNYRSYCRNFEKWEIFGQSLNRETEQITSLTSYEEHYKFLANWINQRLEWLNTCFHEESFLTEWTGSAVKPGEGGPVDENMGNQTALDLFEGYTLLKVNADSAAATVEGNHEEGVENLFDFDFFTKYCADIGGGWWWGHWGGWGDWGDWNEPSDGEDDNTVDITFSLTEASALSGYAFCTANDTSVYADRNPESWVLYGKASDGSWVQVDACDSQTMGMQATDFCYYGRLCTDAAAYTDYKLTITHRGTLQLSEIALFGAPIAK